MPDPTPESALAEVEQAIEAGRFADARSALEAAERRFGGSAAVTELRQRLAEVERIAARPQVEELIAQAREAIRRAEYPTAIRALDQAVEQAPDDPEIRALRDQTDKAALRYLKQLKRNQAIRDEAERIERAIERGQLASARQLLADAGLKYGKHGALSSLQEKLDEVAERGRRERAGRHVERARELISERAWHAADDELAAALKLDPASTEAETLRETLRGELEREETERQRRRAIEAARGDVERMLAAGELERASGRLREAIDSFGREEAFVELSHRLTGAKVDAQARHRLDWAERRANEAASLVKEADRLSLQGRFEAAVERLRRAREIDTESATIAGKLATATAALERLRAKQRRAEVLAAREAAIDHELEALHLEEAARMLAAARQELGAEPSFDRLAARLERLRQAEAGTAPGSRVSLDDSAGAARLRALSEAYSWRQTLLYPFRGLGGRAFWGLAAVLLACDVLAALPAVGGLFAALRWLAIAAALACHLAVVRATAGGGNLLPPLGRLGGPARALADLLLYALWAALALLPLGTYLALRGERLLAPEASLADFLAAALLGWLAAALVTLAAGAAGSFGSGRGFRFDRHPRALHLAAPDAVFVVDLVFAPLVLVVFLRTVLLPLIPWLGAPLSALVESWWLLGAPHWMGVLVRRHRSELASLYA